jgi:hypothetical protein
VALAGVLVVAAGLRLTAIGSGIPYALGPDEPAIVDHVVQMLRDGSLRPPFFDYPGLVFYLHLPVAGLRFLAGVASGEWETMAAANGAEFYLWARVATALCGVATVFLVFRIGLRWGARHGLLAAALLAVMPMHVRESRYALTDVPMTFFVTLAVLLSLRAYASPRLLAFVLAGAAVGFGTAIKYTAGAALLVPLLAAWLVKGARHGALKSTAAVGAGFVIAFAAGAPYALLDLQGFVAGLGNLASAYRPRGPDEDHAAWIYAKHLLMNFHWPAFAMAALGIIVAAGQLVRSPRRLPLAMVAVFPLAFVAALGNYTPVFGRYVLPVLPVVCLAAAIAIAAVSSGLGRIRLHRAVPLARLAIVAVVLLPPAVHSARFVRAQGVASTKTMAYRWFEENVPPGAVVVVERGVLRFPSDLYRSIFVPKIRAGSMDHYRAMGARYLVWAPDPAQVDSRAVVEELLGETPDGSVALEEFMASADQPGPDLRILKLPDECQNPDGCGTPPPK